MLHINDFLADIRRTIMGYYIQRHHKPKATPRERLIAELIASDTPVPVPVEYALNNIFNDISIDEFCSVFNLECRQVTYSYKHKNKEYFTKAFFEFSFINPNEENE